MLLKNRYLHINKNKKMKKNNKTTSKKTTNKKLPTGITMDNKSYRVRKMIKGNSISSNFSTLKGAINYLKLLTK